MLNNLDIDENNVSLEESLKFQYYYMTIINYIKI